MPVLPIASPLPINGLALVRSGDPTMVNLVYVRADGTYGNPALTFAQEDGSNLIHAGRMPDPAVEFMRGEDGRIFI